jgi:KDO2-lipid IV(A) lauroyltransferase
MPYRFLHILGKILGIAAFYFMVNYRKRALSNLALAKDLKLSKKELFRIAKRSFQNLAINVLEYPRLAREKNFSKIIKCENPEVADEIYKKKRGIIFFCGHQSNWEVLFLDGNLRMRGIAIGKPIKNKRLYKWIISIREKTGGKIIMPRNAIKESLKGLKDGKFIGIVGDQGMPDSNYSFPFLGRRAWTSTIPALLACKTNSPIIVATTRRKKGKYYINYSKPIWPNVKNPVEKEVVRLMDESLTILQESIKKTPGQWLWQHNRWKQQTPKVVNRNFRYDSICVILPKEKGDFERIRKYLFTLKSLYPRDFIFLFLPKAYENEKLIEVNEMKIYEDIEEVMVEDYRFKLIYNFTKCKKIKNFYKGLSAFDVFNERDLKKIAESKYPNRKFKNFSEILISALCHKNFNFSKE